MTDAGDRFRPGELGRVVPGQAKEVAVEASVYRPVSLLAIASLGMAVLYSFIVVLGSIGAYFTNTPWLMSLWTILIPAVAVVLALLSLRQIRQAEGTLAGARIAQWGLVFSLVLGLGYLAYYGMSFFLIGREADAFGRTFLTNLVQGNIDSAFRLTLSPTERRTEPPNFALAGLGASTLGCLASPWGQGSLIAAAALVPGRIPDPRNDLEIRYNTLTDRGTPGRLSQFYQYDAVRLLAQAGAQTQVESLGVSAWEFTRGGYQVSIPYRVTTPLAAFRLTLTFQGNESRYKESEGRQWYVQWGQTVMTAPTIPSAQSPPSGPELALTPYGVQLLSLANEARQVIQNWQRRFGEGRADEAYLATLLPDERQRLRSVYAASVLGEALALASQAGGALPGPLLAQGALMVDAELLRLGTLPGYQQFREGNLVRAEPQVFWIPDPARRQATIDLARQMFLPYRQNLLKNFDVLQVRVPLIREEQGRLVLGQDFQMRLPTAGSIIEGWVVIDRDVRDLAGGAADSWRIRSMDLSRSKTMPTPSLGPPPPPGPS